MMLLRSRYTKPLVLAGALTLGTPACHEADPKNPATWIAKLDDAEPKNVVEALSQLRKLKAKESVNAVIPFLKNDDNDIKEAAAYALEEFGDKSAVDPLVAAGDLNSSAKGADRANTKIAEALGSLGDPKAVPTLLKMLTAKSNYIQLAAVESLGKLKDQRAIDPLIKLVESDDTLPPLRKHAILALGEMKAQQAIPALTKALVIEGNGASFFLESDWALLQLRPASATAISSILSGDNKDYEAWAAEHKRNPAGYFSKGAVVLGDISDPGSLAALEKALQWKDKDRNYVYEDLVHTHVAEALGRIHATQAAPAMAAQFGSITDANMRARYGRALALLGEKSVLSKVEASIKDKKSSITARAESVHTLGLLGDGKSKGVIEAVRKSDAPETLLASCLKEAGDDATSKTVCENGSRDWKTALDDATAQLAAGDECKDDPACWTKKLSDTNVRVRERAAFELGHNLSPVSIDGLLVAAKDAKNDVRRAAYFGLEWATQAPPTQAIMKQKAAALAEQYEKDKTSTALGGVNEDLKRVVWKAQNL